MTKRTQQQKQRLDQAMERRRLQLGLEWREVADRAGVSYETLRALRKSGVASSLSKRRIEGALQWAPGSIDNVLINRDPVEIDTDISTTQAGRPRGGVPPARRQHVRDELLRRVEEMQRQLSELRQIMESGEFAEGEEEDSRRAIG